jgi:hypothetical protein
MIPAPAHSPAVHPPANPSPAARAAALSDVLTTEEREYFAKLEQLGPLTYGRRPAVPVPATDAPRGQRIDVRA